MKEPRNREELDKGWTLGPDELALLSGKRGATRLGYAARSRKKPAALQEVLFAYYEAWG